MSKLWKLWPDQKYTCGRYNTMPKGDILRMLGKLKKRIMLIRVLVFTVILLGFSDLKEKRIWII